VLVVVATPGSSSYSTVDESLAFVSAPSEFLPISLSKENEHYRSINDRFVANTKGKSAAMKNLISGFFSDPDEQAMLLSQSHDAVVDCQNTLSIIEKGLALVVNHIR
jgi:hypothetical protein